MKYLLTYNEGLFNAPDDNSIARNVLENFQKINKPNVIYTSSNGIDIYIAKDLKLDLNPGTYTLTISKNKFRENKPAKYELKIEYFKNNKLQFTKNLNCLNTINSVLYKKIAAKYVNS